MQRSNVAMSNIPSHGNATQAKVGNARENFGQGRMQMPGQLGGGVQEMTCHFPQPAPKRVYCHPAAFTSLDGRDYHRILDAYGHSRPAQGYY